MAGRSYSIRGALKPQLGAPATKLNPQGKTPPPPKQPNRIPSSVSLKRFPSQRG